MKSNVKKVKFIFEIKSTKSPLRSTKTVSFFNFMEQDRIGDGFKFPFTYQLHYTDKFSSSDLGTDVTNVLVVPMNIDYIKQLDFDVLYDLQDKHSNVILLADYSNESNFPANYRTRNNIENNFETERFICTMLSLHNGEEIPEPKFKKVFPIWMFATGVLDEILDRRNEKHLHNIPPFTWPGKETFKQFFFPNRLGRVCRLDLIVKAHKEGLLDKCEWTLMLPSTEGYLDEYNPHHEYFKLFGTEHKGIDHTEFEYKWSHPTSDFNQGGPHEAFPMTVLERTLAVIISDTYNDNNLLSDGSEKILKPLMYGMPVFYNGRTGVINKLKEFGFWFPGSDYNDILDAEERSKQMIEDCLNFETVISKETADRVKQNKQLMFDRNTHYKFSKELFDYILDF